MTRVLLLALRPHLVRAIRIVRVGREKIHPATGLRAVADDDGGPVVTALDGNGERLAVVARGDLGAVDGDLAEGEADGVELHLLAHRVDADDVERGHAVDAAGGHVEHQGERQSVDAEGPVSLELPLGRGEGERTGAPGGDLLPLAGAIAPGGSGVVLEGASAALVQAVLERHGAGASLPDEDAPENGKRAV